MTTTQMLHTHRWFFVGMRCVVSLPAFILMSAFVGFAGFAFEAGLPLPQTVFMVGAVWALPAKVLLVGSIIAGASLPAAFLAVSLSSIRMMPMVAALVPEIRTRTTPTWLLLVLSHFVAVTAWVVTMERVRDIPREGRIAFFAGFAMTLTGVNIVIVAIAYRMVSELPALVAGALFFLTPIYFLTSIWASARAVSDRAAMAFGLVLGPVFHGLAPDVDILLAGLVGGTLGLALTRLARRRQSAFDD